MVSTSDKGVIDHIKANWVIYAFIVQLIITWATFNARLTTAEASILDLQMSDKESRLVLAQMNTKLASLDVGIAKINTSLEWLKTEHQ